MSRLTFMQGLHFDIYVLDLFEEIKPKSCKDLEDLSEELHERLEMAIQDYIHDYDDEILDIHDYESRY